MKRERLVAQLMALLALSACMSSEPLLREDIQALQIVKGTRQGIPYPLQQVRLLQQGYVLIEHGVSPDGKVDAPKIMHSDPLGVFDAAVLRETARWRFDLPQDWPQKWQTVRFPFLFIFRLGDCDAPLPPVDVSGQISCVPRLSER